MAPSCDCGVDREAYALRVRRSLIPMGRTFRMLGVHFVRGGDGPRLVARSTHDLLPCTSAKASAAHQWSEEKQSESWCRLGRAKLCDLIRRPT